jgi:predicted DNA-binding WGR domain protein
MSNTRNFEFKNDKSSKFWEITQTGSTVTVRYGKTGTNGQTQEKVFDDASSASRHVAKLIAEKTGKGYVERCETEQILNPVSNPVKIKIATGKEQIKASKDLARIKPHSPLQDLEASPESLSAMFNKDDSINRQLAKHPKASADLLEKLSHSSDEATRRNVASNPNTLPETLIKLGQQFPKEFLANPALDLLLMIQPTLMEEVPQSLLIRLLKQDHCPPSLLTWAADHLQAKVQLAVAMNAKAPEQALEKLRASPHASVKDAVKTSIGNIEKIPDPEMAFEQAVRDRLASMKSTELLEAWSEGDIGLAQWIALPLTFRLDKATALCFGPEHIARVLRDTKWTFDKLKEALPNYLYWDQVASDLATPSHVLEHMAKEPDAALRRSLARNPSTPVHVLTEVALDSESEIRAAIAVNRSTPVPVLVALSQDPDSDVRSNIARNSSTPDSVLKILANDSDSGVRLSVVRNHLTPLTVLSMFALDSDDWVRSQAALNPAMPIAELESLAKDSDDDVRLSVAGNISFPVEMREVLLGALVKKLDKYLRKRIAGNPSTVVAILKALSKDPESEVRWTVAENKSTPVDVLEALANDSDISVRQSVALNPSAPVAVLEALAKELDSGLRWIRRSVAENPSTPASVLAELAQDWDSSVRELVARNLSTPSSWLVELAEDEETRVRAAVAANLTSPTELLAQLSSDRTVDVLIAVANNPNTPVTALLPLVKSKSGNVRSAIASQAHRSEKIFSALSNDSNVDVRRALSNNFELETQVLDEFALFVETEADWVNLLSHPNLSKQGVQFIADQLFNTSAADSPWFKNEVSTVPLDLEEAALSSSVLSYFGRNPNKTVLAKRPLAPVMALCAAQAVDPSRIVKVVGSTDWLVRAAVARNPGTPPSLLKKLSADAHQLVAALARSNMSNAKEVGE